MDFRDRILALSTQVGKIVDQRLIKTEEGTKTSMVMPFITALGYDVADPTEVTPELIADVGVKKGEKVDYAILKDGQPIILFECKICGTNLGDVQASQLYRYFSVTSARFGILTDGVVYHFFTDLEATNKMDTKPFLVFDMRDPQDVLIEELKKFTKGAFNIDLILSTASELKYTSAIKRIITTLLAQPTEEFVRLFASQVYNGRLTQQVMTQFTEITKRAWREVINERMKATFEKVALAQETPSPDEAAVDVDGADTTKVQTTEDEMEGYRIVRAIVREVVDATRVTLRDAQSYCSIILDDNNRKPICRLHFNSTTKRHIGLFNGEKQEERIHIQRLEDIYNHADRLKATVNGYLHPTGTNPAET